jgi:hypothetical protein
MLRALAAMAGLALATAASAQLSIRVQLDTSSLIAAPAGPFSLDFQLVDGSGVGNANNWVNISNLQFGGGAAAGAGNTAGGAFGDLSSSIVLTDTDFFNEFYQEFTPGSWLAFDLTFSTNSDGVTPDRFSFAILDSNLFNLPTQSGGDDVLLAIDLTGQGPEVTTYGSLDFAISAPVAVPVPEPSTYALASAFGLLGLTALRRLRRAQAKA